MRPRAVAVLLSLALSLVAAAPTAGGDTPDHWPYWATDVETLCTGLGLWGWVEPQPLTGTNTVRLVIYPPPAADWPECDAGG